MEPQDVIFTPFRPEVGEAACGWRYADDNIEIIRTSNVIGIFRPEWAEDGDNVWDVMTVNLSVYRIVLI